MDESNNMRAIKVISMEEANEETIASNLNEIELLKRLQNSDRVVRMFD